MTEILPLLDKRYNLAAIDDADEMQIHVHKFALGDYVFGGGIIKIVANGTWYVGPDLFTNSLVSLSRVGHRGFIPVARVVAFNGAIISIDQIAPVLPTSRLPNTINKIVNGKKIKVYVLGTDLSVDDTQNSWGSLLFSGDGSYSVCPKNKIEYANIASNGGANMLTLSLTGIRGKPMINTWDSGLVTNIATNTARTGRSTGFNTVDLVVVNVLQGVCDKRLELIEPILKNIRRFGVEVLIVTEHARPSPFANYDALVGNATYKEGRNVFAAADLYGCEIADTAAYMADAYFRHGPQMYSTSEPEMYSETTAAGSSMTPSCGAEVWARAVRSCFPVKRLTSGENGLFDLSYHCEFDQQKTAPPSKVSGPLDYKPKDDYQYPNDSFYTIARDEYYIHNGLNGPYGTLSYKDYGESLIKYINLKAHTSGYNILTLPTEKYAWFGMFGMITCGLIIRAPSADVEIRVKVGWNSTRRITVPAYKKPTRGMYVELYDSTDFSYLGNPDFKTVQVYVEGGELEIISFIASTREMTFIPSDNIKIPELYHWASYSSDPGVAAFYNMITSSTRAGPITIQCPDYGAYVHWIVVKDPGATSLQEYGGSDYIFQDNMSGDDNLIVVVGGTRNPGGVHSITPYKENPGKTYGFRLLGVIITHDR